MLELEVATIHRRWRIVVEVENGEETNFLGRWTSAELA
jgi:hypothetical protein